MTKIIKHKQNIDKTKQKIQNKTKQQNTKHLKHLTLNCNRFKRNVLKWKQTTLQITSQLMNDHAGSDRRRVLLLGNTYPPPT